MKYSIELDCPPTKTRPGDLIGGVIKGTVLEGRVELRPENTTHRIFGEWAWEFELETEEYEKLKDVVFKRISKLYERRVIRYGSIGEVRDGF